MTKEELELMLYEITLIAIGAGKIIMEYYGNVEYECKNDDSPLTQADLESNAYIIHQITNRYPLYKICSEESVLEYKQRAELEYYFLIDPLDGTKDFLSQNGNFAINIALIYRDIPVLGVIYAPALYEVYIAANCFGAYGYNIAKLKDKVKNNNVDIAFLRDFKIPLCVENIQRIFGDQLRFLEVVEYKIKYNIIKCKLELSNKKIIACDSISNSTSQTQEYIKSINAITFKRGASLKFCMVACGLADLYPRFNGTSEWDSAAGDVILREAGGVIIDLDSKKPLSYNKENLRNNYFIAYGRGISPNMLESYYH